MVEANEGNPRSRLVGILGRIKGGWDCLANEILDSGKPSSFGPESSDVREAAGYLHRLGLASSAKRLLDSYAGFVVRLTDVFFADMARDKTPEERAAMLKRFGRFPTPAEDPAEHAERQKVRAEALAGRANINSRFVEGLLVQLQPQSPLKQEPSASMEQPWSDDAPEYLPLTLIRKLTDCCFALSTLSRLCKRDGEIRYMRKPGFGCKAHAADFLKYMKGRQSDPAWAKAYMHWLAAPKTGRTRLFWKCDNPACGHEYPDGEKAKDTCPKCKAYSKLIQKPPPEPGR